MDNLSTQDIVDAGLADWRKLAQRLHARYRTGDAGVGAAFLADAVGAASAASLADHLEATLEPPTWTCGSPATSGPTASGCATTTSRWPGCSATWPGGMR